MAITGEATLSEDRFVGFLSRLAEEPPDFLQVRDKTAPDARLTRLLARAVETLPGTKVLANGRFDLALAAAAAGVVLPESGLPIAPVRRETPRGFLVGRSAHSVAAVRTAFEEGADLVLLGPIFPTPSKASYGPALSPSILEDLPEREPPAEIYLVGGIDLETLARLESYRGRFAGVAAIRAIESAPSPSGVIAAMKAR